MMHKISYYVLMSNQNVSFLSLTPCRVNNTELDYIMILFDYYSQKYFVSPKSKSFE